MARGDDSHDGFLSLEGRVLRVQRKPVQHFSLTPQKATWTDSTEVDTVVTVDGSPTQFILHGEHYAIKRGDYVVATVDVRSPAELGHDEPQKPEQPTVSRTRSYGARPSYYTLSVSYKIAIGRYRLAMRNHTQRRKLREVEDPASLTVYRRETEVCSYQKQPQIPQPTP